MKDTNRMISTAVSSLLALGVMTASGNAMAGKKDVEKCYGVVKAGKNDCAGPGHTCQGQARSDADPNEFILVPDGTCERLVNGEVR